MDNFDSLIFDGLLDRYIEEQVKFEKGQVVYIWNILINIIIKLNLVFVLAL